MVCVIRFDVCGMFEEVKKNFRSEFPARYGKNDIANVWNMVFKYVLNYLNNYTGVDIPNLGTFTFAELHVRDQGVIHVKPFFVASRHLRQMYGIKQASHQSIKYLKNDVRIMKLNTAVIADELNIHPHSAEVCVKEVLSSLSRLLKDGKCVDFPFTGIGVLQFRNNEVSTIFKKDLVRNLFLPQKKDMCQQNTNVKNSTMICETIQEQCYPADEPIIIPCPAVREVIRNKNQNKCRRGFDPPTIRNQEEPCLIGNSIPRPQRPPGEEVSAMEASYYSSNNKPSKLPPKTETFFEKVPITRLRTQEQVEIALGEVDEHSKKTVCPKCAGGLRNNIKYEHAHNNSEKIHKIMEKFECEYAVYDDTEDAVRRLKRNKEIAEYNKRIEKVQDQQKKVRYCEPQPGIFYARPSSAGTNAAREKKYGDEIRETFLQKAADKKAEAEERFRQEVKERERSLQLIREDTAKEKAYLQSRKDIVVRGNEEYMADKVRRHNERYLQEYCDPSRYSQDPHLLFEKKTHDDKTSQQEYIKNTAYNLAKAAVQKKNECLEHKRKLAEELKVLGRVKEMCRNNPVRALKKQLMKETVAAWEKAKCERDIRGEEVLDRLRQPNVGLLDTLCQYKRCTVCKRNLECTGGNIEGTGREKFIV